ncbi:MAG: integrin alpha [Chloroflexi bacterium]|nr:integrin alpha [Chloroflexota bacterium]MCI0581059.1 integrin alpha [Chloroflexota bacterium]MCI0650139.1 integrin alpha [Chloroflexota bacterium]MCI0730874.1 integrin alpha [Chloroflexota bacterium]
MARLFGIVLTLLVGPGRAGVVYVLGSGRLEDSAGSFLGEAGSNRAGISVAGAGEINGGDYGDLLIGIPSNDGSGDAGAAYLVSGGWALGSRQAISAVRFPNSVCADRRTSLARGFWLAWRMR